MRSVAISYSFINLHMLIIYIGFTFFYNYYCFHFSKISVYSNVYVPNYMIFNPPSSTQLILYI